MVIIKELVTKNQVRMYICICVIVCVCVCGNQMCKYMWWLSICIYMLLVY